MKIGHLPTFTDNPYVLAKMSEGYNAELRKLATREGLQLIDLDAWSHHALTPRDEYFSDSVHLYEDGQEMIGSYIVGELSPTVKGVLR